MTTSTVAPPAGALASVRHVPVPAIEPGAWLGLLGGGQLGRMFCMAAQSMGYRVCVLDPGEEGPAASVADRHICADYTDAAALDALSALCRAATTEFENVPAEALRMLGERCVVSPGADAVAIAQDRIAEKRFVQSCGVPVAPHAAVLHDDDLQRAPAELFPGILKVARLGYDGKGQFRVADRAEALQAFASTGRVACVLERRLDLAMEVSVVVARGFGGQVALYPVSENLHRGGILATSTVPAAVPRDAADAAAEATLRIAERLDYVGVLCVEFFVLGDGSLCVNEIAPRPHNSGHYTIDACVTSQFEQQTRVLAGLPLGATELHLPAVMLNLLGDLWQPNSTGGAREPDWRVVLEHGRAKLHLYGKKQPRPGRKMGHVTVLGSDRAAASAVARQISLALGIPVD